jgi:hypothetical protein
MNYSCEGEYMAAMNAQAEAEAYYEQEMAYQEYLESLIEAKKFDIFAAYVALDWLESKEFADSGLTAIEFIQNKLKTMLKPKEQPKSTQQEPQQPKINNSLPF